MHKTSIFPKIRISIMKPIFCGYVSNFVLFCNNCLFAESTNSRFFCFRFNSMNGFFQQKKKKRKKPASPWKCASDNFLQISVKKFANKNLKWKSKWNSFQREVRSCLFFYWTRNAELKYAWLEIKIKLNKTKKKQTLQY